MLQRWSVKWRENSNLTEVASLMGGRMVMLQRRSLMEGEWSFYRGGQFNGGGIVMLQRWLV